MNSTLVSITLSAYNVEQYLAEALDCICGQTYLNIEILCIDDGSTGGIVFISNEYADSCPNV